MGNSFTKNNDFKAPNLKLSLLNNYQLVNLGEGK